MKKAICKVVGHAWLYDRLGWDKPTRHCCRCGAIHVFVVNETSRDGEHVMGDWCDWHTELPVRT